MRARWGSGDPGHRGLHPAIVIASEDAGQTISIEWSATARNVDGIAGGTLQAHVADGSLDLFALIEPVVPSDDE